MGNRVIMMCSMGMDNDWVGVRISALPMSKHSIHPVQTSFNHAELTKRAEICPKLRDMKLARSSQFHVTQFWADFSIRAKKCAETIVFSGLHSLYARERRVARRAANQASHRCNRLRFRCEPVTEKDSERN